MTLIRLFLVITVLFFAASYGAGQRTGGRRVYTNEDVAPPAAPAPPAESVPEPASEAAPEAPAAAPSAAAQPQGPASDLQQAMELQQVLRQNLESIQAKVATEANAARKNRWTAMSALMNQLLQRNQEAIDDLAAQNQQRSSPQARPES